MVCGPNRVEKVNKVASSTAVARQNCEIGMNLSIQIGLKMMPLLKSGAERKEENDSANKTGWYCGNNSALA